jgi:Transposase IS116/IS110/IS902 family
LAHVHNPNSPYNLPAIGTKMASKANRDGGAERLADPAVHKSIAVDLALISDDDERLRDVELTLLKTAKHHDAHTLSLRQTGTGIGKILSLVLHYESHDINRVPTVQDVVSYGRLGKCAQESAGKRLDTSGTQIGNAHLTWAFSEAAVLCLRDHPPAQQYLARLEKTHDKGKALTELAHQLARAVYDLCKRPVVFDKAQFFQRSWRGADEPGASLATQGMNLPNALDTAAAMVSWNAQARIGRETRSPAR